MTKIEHIARGIIIHEGKILLCKSLEHGYYYLPGGHVEEGELPEVALGREMIEELGRPVQKVKYITRVENSFVQDKKERTERVDVYLATLENYQNLKSLEKHIAFDWVPIAEFDSVDFKPEKAKDDMIRCIEENKNFYC